MAPFLHTASKNVHVCFYFILTWNC